jgi:hypothetical protein
VSSVPFTLLDDQPYEKADDPLDFQRIAHELADLIRASHGSTPLALGVESGWGMGKSTLMNRLRDDLAADEEHVTTVWFNAWTAKEGEALEGLVKSVLDKLDHNILRKAARNEKLITWVRALGLVVADWLKLGSLLDTLWREVGIDPKTRNEVNRLVVTSMSEWTKMRDDKGPSRLLVVFVDDLDRCPPANVLQVFEAIKLYLDAPGLVFVIGYDRDVVSDAVLNFKQYSDAVKSYHYVEKIIQLVYRLPSISDKGAEALLTLYLGASGTTELFDEPGRSLAIDQNGRNPRRIKRFINAFILEYGLDSEWQEIGAKVLARVLIIDLYFPEFALLLRSRQFPDPVGDFRGYVVVRNIVRRGGDSAEDKRRVGEVMTSHGLAAPSGDLEGASTELEKELPPSFPALARNSDFLALLEGIEDIDRLRDKLRRFSPTGAAASLAGQRAEGGPEVVLTADEQKHLDYLFRNKATDYKGGYTMRSELRHLRSLGLIEMRGSHGIEEMRSNMTFDLADYVRLTDLGRKSAELINEAKKAKADRASQEHN